MPIVAINNVGAIGVVTDTPPQELPPEVWTAATNVRFRDGVVEKFAGHSAQLGAPAVAPHWLLPVQESENYYWVYAGLDKIYAISGTTHYNITRQTASVDVDYTGTVDNIWNGGILTGIPILNNGVDDPQMWNTPATGTKLVALSNWPANTKAAVIRPFKNFLVALDVTKSGVRFEQMVKWSHSADPGAVPTTWDPADTTKDAGETDLSETGDRVIDCLPLKDVNIIYKEGSTYGMQYIGGTFIFRFFKIFATLGVMHQRCVKEIEGRHLVLGTDDLVLHDGQQIKPLLSRRLRRWLFSAINEDNYKHCFIVPNIRKDEMWICVPEAGSTYASIALIWNYREDTLGFRALDDIAHIGYGIVEPGAEDTTWDADSDTWDSDSSTWGERTFSSLATRLLMAKPTSGSEAFQMADDTNQFAGTNFEAMVERTGLAVVGKDRQGNPKSDISIVKQVTEVWPDIEAPAGTVVNIYVGYQHTIEEGVTWGSAFTFTVGTDRKINCRVSGRFLAVRFSITANVAWKLRGYKLNIQPMGLYW